MHLGFKALAFPIPVMIGTLVSSTMPQAACAQPAPLFQIAYDACHHYAPMSDNDTTYTWTDKQAALRACLRESAKNSLAAWKSRDAHGALQHSKPAIPPHGRRLRVRRRANDLGAA